MRTTPYLQFNGNCNEAIHFYSEVFKSSPQVLTFKEANQGEESYLPPMFDNLVMYGELDVFGEKVVFGDVSPGSEYVVGNNIFFTITHEDVNTLKHVYEKLSENGHVKVQLQKTDWNECFGLVTDKYGITWQILCEQ